MYLSISLLVSLLGLVAAGPLDLPADFNRYAPIQQGITWEPCGSTSNQRYCGRFEVPLDYANQTAGKASLAAVMYPATVKPKVGTLFVNPGGPGGEGVGYILGSAGDTIMNAAGGAYDIVSWDPRGVGRTYPKVECFATMEDARALWGRSLFWIGLEARGNFTDPADLQAFYDYVPGVDQELLAFGKQCLQYMPDTFQYLGTAAAVRDMVAMHDYLEGPDKPINYWGLSYGTVIGIYMVNMFPTRVGRVVLDGVVDPVYWANRPAHEIWAINVESADEALTGFVQACAAAGPAGCAIAVDGSTADSLRIWIQQLLDMAYDYRKAAGAQASFDSFDVRAQLFQGMYAPSQWKDLAVALKGRYDIIVSAIGSPAKRSTPLSNFDRRHTLIGEFDLRTRQSSEAPPDYAIQAITCADAVDPGDVTTQMVFDYLVKVTREVSPMFGPRWGIAGFYCHHWPVRAVERFTGPWNNKLSNPILVIGNEADPITPYRSAKAVADALGDSATLVEQDDYGHCSLAMHSDCTFSILADYFINNKLPTADQFCGTNQVLFPGQGITKSSISSLSVTSGNSGSTDVQSQLNAARARVQQLFVATVALGCALGLLVVFLVGSWLLRRQRGGSGKKDLVYWGKEGLHNEKEQGHDYKTPYDSASVAKLGGYTSVKT
ncbi:hypothetical protein FRC07_012564 [Ceratobasidium sp. 392]|nr:hypothetical protein FRC07_012564 [Ceratobasidium sp. 392]